MKRQIAETGPEISRLRGLYANFRLGVYFPFVLIFLFATASPTYAEPSLFSDGGESPDPAASQQIETDQKASNDAKMARRLRDIFANIEGLETVEVEVEDGIVRLQGVLATATAIDKAEGLAHRLEGVVLVDNQLQLNREVGSRLNTTWDDLASRLLNFFSLLPLLLIAVVVVVVFVLLARLLSRWQALFDRVSPNTFIADLVRQFLQLVIILAGVVLALQVIGAGAAVTSVAGGLGIVGLALGFATRDTIENYIASILLSLKQPFAPQDHVIITDKEGIVVRLTSRATILMSFDGNHIRIPNAVVYKSTIVNYTRNPQRRFDFEVGVSTDTELKMACSQAQDALSRVPGLLDDPVPQCIVKGFGDSSVQLEVLGWVDQLKADFVKVRSESIRMVKAQFEDAGIDMPNPIYNIYLEDIGGGMAPIARYMDTGEEPDVSRREATVKAEPGDRKSASGSRQEPESRPEDVKPDKVIQKQIAAEAANQNADNLLDPNAPKE